VRDIFQYFDTVNEPRNVITTEKFGNLKIFLVLRDYLPWRGRHITLVFLLRKNVTTRMAHVPMVVSRQ